MGRGGSPDGSPGSGVRGFGFPGGEFSGLVDMIFFSALPDSVFEMRQMKIFDRLAR